MAALELAEELVVQVVSICEENQRRIFHRWVLDDAPGVEEHRETLAGTLRVPDDADTTVATFAAFHLAGPIVSDFFCTLDRCRANRFTDRGVDGVKLMIA